MTTTNSGGVNASEPVSCYNPPADTLDVPGSFPLFSLQGSGYVKYFCNNSTLDLDGEAYANVSSPDGVWVGECN